MAQYLLVYTRDGGSHQVETTANIRVQVAEVVAEGVWVTYPGIKIYIPGREVVRVEIHTE